MSTHEEVLHSLLKREFSCSAVFKMLFIFLKQVCQNWWFLSRQLIEFHMSLERLNQFSDEFSDEFAEGIVLPIHFQNSSLIALSICVSHSCLMYHCDWVNICPTNSNTQNKHSCSINKQEMLAGPDFNSIKLCWADCCLIISLSCFSCRLMITLFLSQSAYQPKWPMV